MSTQQSKAPKVIELEVEYDFPSAFPAPPTHVPFVRATRPHASVPASPVDQPGTSEKTIEPRLPDEPATPPT